MATIMNAGRQITPRITAVIHSNTLYKPVHTQWETAPSAARFPLTDLFFSKNGYCWW